MSIKHEYLLGPLSYQIQNAAINNVSLMCILIVTVLSVCQIYQHMYLRSNTLWQKQSFTLRKSYVLTCIEFLPKLFTTKISYYKIIAGPNVSNMKTHLNSQTTLNTCKLLAISHISILKCVEVFGPQKHGVGAGLGNCGHIKKPKIWGMGKL